MKKEQEHWKDLSIKDKVAVSTCLIAFFIGWILVIAGFIVDPLGVISDSILWVLGQALIYTASVLGIGMYTSSSIQSGLKGIEMRLHKQNHKEDDDIEGGE